MRVLIVSDTHGDTGNLDRVLEKELPVDALVHCGDVGQDEDYIRQRAECPCYIIAGNNDWSLELDRELRTTLDGYRVWITHGHQYGVSAGTEYLQKAGRERGADIVMFGHIHTPVLEEIPEMVILNPGSLTFPRQTGWKPSYIIMETDSQRKLHFQVNYLN